MYSETATLTTNDHRWPNRWGALRIHGELLKLGIDVGQTTAAKYISRRRRLPSQGWKTFLLNHADGIAAMDLVVVPTISFKLLYGFGYPGLQLETTAHPTAEWIARQLNRATGQVSGFGGEHGTFHAGGRTMRSMRISPNWREAFCSIAVARMRKLPLE